MKLEITQQALDDLKRIKKGNKDKALEIMFKIEHVLQKSPFIGKKLKGRYNHQRSYRIGNHRIIYTLTSTTLTIKRIDHRKDVYKK